MAKHSKKMKLLINTPSLKILGGVANHYIGLRAFWTQNVKYNIVGRRVEKSGSGKYWLPWDIFKFMFRLLTFRPNVVLLNPSLGDNALKRDFIFLEIARRLGFKVVIFIHGFNLEYASRINKDWIAKNLNKASMIFVLANAFKKILQSWEVTVPIRLTTTKIDDVLLENFIPSENRIFKNRNILCLTRIEKAKGVYETVDTYAILKRQYNDLTLTFVGDGSELGALKKYVANKNLSDVKFTGRLGGEALSNAYKKADFFLFMSYGEGMPTVVLEAMAFGLPVFTRNVGGLVDFFENGRMGYISDSLNPVDFANAMKPYLENEDQTHKVALYNAQYAKEHFMASSVAQQLESNIFLHLRHFG